MTTSLYDGEVLLSKETGDYWDSTSTGAGSTTTVVDTALMAKADDWVTDNTFVQITKAAHGEVYEERKVSALDNSTGTLTHLAFTNALGTAGTYRVHRLFNAAEKRRALVHSAKLIFPHCFSEIRNESLVSHNWLKDGSFEVWTTSANPTYWTVATVTAAKTTISPYYKHGTTSCKLSTAAGTLKQGITVWDDIKRLAGQTVTFTLQGWCDTASALRIAIYDGTTRTYSDYHDGDSAWTEDNDPLKVEATIDDNPTEITLEIYLATTGNAYVDDARLISTFAPRQYIGDMGLFRNTPHQVLIEQSDYDDSEPWLRIRDYTLDRNNGYIYLPDSVAKDYRLRVLGIGYLDFYDTSDVVGTDWADTIAIDTPQTEILVAEAAIYLCNQMILPIEETGDSTRWERARAYWEIERRNRISKFMMQAPAATIHYGV